MNRRRFTVIAGSVACFGTMLGLLSVPLAWAYTEATATVMIAGFDGSSSHRSSLFDLPNGGWYIAVLLLLVGVGIAAAVTSTSAARALGAAGGVLALADVAVVLAIWPNTEAGDVDINLFGLVRAQTEVSVGPGAPMALTAMLFMGCGIVALGFAADLSPGARQDIA